MAEDWEIKYWANRAAQMQQQRPQTPQYRDVDVASALMQRTMLAQQPSGNAAYLREGANYYRQIQNNDGWGTTTPLIKSMGTLNGVNGKEFAIMGEIQGYCVDNLSTIDLSKINEEPQRMLQLIRVRAPFVGDILVERSAIVNSHNVGVGGRTILKG